MALKSPGSNRYLPPTIPDEIQTMLALMGLTALWTAKRRYVLSYKPSGNVQNTQLWEYDGSGGIEGWSHVLGLISDHIKAMQGGEWKEVKTADRAIVEEMAVAVLHKQRFERDNPFADSIGEADGRAVS